MEVLVQKEIFPFCVWMKTLYENQGWDWGFCIIVIKNIWDFILQRWKGCCWTGTVCWPLHSQLLKGLENNLDLQQDHYPIFFVYLLSFVLGSFLCSSFRKDLQNKYLKDFLNLADSFLEDIFWDLDLWIRWCCCFNGNGIRDGWFISANKKWADLSRCGILSRGVGNAPWVSPSLSCRQRTSTTMKIPREVWTQRVKDPRWQLLPGFSFSPSLPSQPCYWLNTGFETHTRRLCVQPSSCRSITGFSTHTLRTHHPKINKKKGLSPPQPGPCCGSLTEFLQEPPLLVWLSLPSHSKLGISFGFFLSFACCSHRLLPNLNKKLNWQSCPSGLEPTEMIQVLIPWQLRNGVEGLVLLSTTQKPWNSFNYLYLVAFSAFCRYKTCKFWLELKFLFLIFFLSLLAILGFSFLPSFPFPPSCWFGFVSFSCRSSFTSHGFFFALLCVSWAVFSHNVAFLSVKWFFKNSGGSPQVVKGVGWPSTASAAGGKQTKMWRDNFFLRV